ncbi:LacI family DNA-binding transcriptional regulator [Paenibacillus piri]|uniref:LacI family transcriptional regulator n=1 Tax=Paenibacillus piri TaxID=2547395 RepID=A0A4R5KDJ5_9BACL|nr:LacI family DNA-binding transcriptional regulator [Paenibacillus piri]TDF93293.1 LacI family transcriptional regulator [Paenibacillus piri]
MVSSKDVAKLAGCSQATVSRVLNNPESVRPDTRTKVLNAMKALNYQPNLAARSLVARSTRTIALVSGTLKNNFFAQSTDQIVTYAAGRGYKTMVYFENEGSLEEMMTAVQGYKVDGIIVSCVKLDDPHFTQLEQLGIPYMLFNRRHRSACNYVAMDNEAAGGLLTRHLLDMGHRDIAYLSGPPDISTFYERWAGFEKAMAEARLSVRQELVHFNASDALEAQKLAWKLMQLASPPTAIICVNDEMAIACLDALLSMGLSVPSQVALAGFDDIGLASHQAIQLTSVGQHKFRMGEMAAEHLIAMIEAGPSDRTRPQDEPRIQIKFKPELFVRRSTSYKI